MVVVAYHMLAGRQEKVLISRIMQLARAYTKNHWTFYDFVTGGSAVLTQ